MLMSKLLGERFKEKPAEASSVSHIFLLRGGYMRQVTNGIYTLLLPAKKVASKIENIIREEMNRIEGQEVMFPVTLPGELWQESGRFESVGSELLRFKDRTGKNMVLGMTHEEAAVHLARTEAKSYQQYPFMIYQIQTKFRDEPRSRGGLIRVREFTMKDAYSFHTSQEDLEQYYLQCLEAYNKIFARAGVPEVVCVASDTGMMGGKVAHEFMLLCDIGEDTIVLCDTCNYQSNMEVATSQLIPATTDIKEIKEAYTPDLKDMESVAGFFQIATEATVKATVFKVEGSDKPLVVFIRGDLQVNTAKLQKITKASVEPYDTYEKSNLVFGFIGPHNLDTSDITVLYDQSLENETNLVAGANKIDHHISGLNIKRDLGNVTFHDIAEVNEGHQCPHCSGKLKFSRGVEVGNIFQLGTKYTESMKMQYIDSDGKAKTPIMGCYGIGVGRLLACIIESHHDDFGPIWPISVAPWQIHICVLKSKTFDMFAIGNELYNRLSEKYEVIMDDRNVGPGAQFADADLLGIPVRIVIGEKNLKDGKIEIVTRDKSIKELIDLEQVPDAIDRIVTTLKNK